MGREEILDAGRHKFTDGDRQKSHESKRVNSSIRKSALKYRGFPVTEAKDILFMASYGIPPEEQTLGNLIALRAAVDAAKGDKDARRDYLKMTGDDPEEKRRDEELKLKKRDSERRNPKDDGGPTIFEQMVRELYERPD